MSAHPRATSVPSTYAARLATFDGYWTAQHTTARQLAALGHVSDRPPLEVLEQGSRCVVCSAFVKRDLAIHALGDAPPPPAAPAVVAAHDLDNFAFHHPGCPMLQMRIPLEPQALLAGDGHVGHGASRIESLRARFERRAPRPVSTPPPASTTATSPERAPTQASPFFALPTELRLQIYAHILPALDPSATEIVPLHRDSARVVTRSGYDKPGARDTSKPNLLRTCRRVHAEALELLYAHTAFHFEGTRTLWLFLRSIGSAGRAWVREVDVRCGAREDALALALLAACGGLKGLTVRLPRPVLLPPRPPLWCEEGVAALLALRGLEKVRAGECWAPFGCLREGSEGAEVLRRELTRARGEVLRLDA